MHKHVYHHQNGTEKNIAVKCRVGVFIKRTESHNKTKKTLWIFLLCIWIEAIVESWNGIRRHCFLLFCGFFLFLLQSHSMDYEIERRHSGMVNNISIQLANYRLFTLNVVLDKNAITKSTTPWNQSIYYASPDLSNVYKFTFIPQELADQICSLACFQFDNPRV